MPRAIGARHWRLMHNLLERIRPLRCPFGSWAPNPFDRLTPGDVTSARDKTETLRKLHAHEAKINQFEFLVSRSVNLVVRFHCSRVAYPADGLEDFGILSERKCAKLHVIPLDRAAH